MKYPPKDLKEFEDLAYRWVHDPIQHELNFLPNYVLDKFKNSVSGYENGIFSQDEKCLRCSLSMYSSPDAAKINHKKLPQKLKIKLGYTHVAEGKIEKTDGKMTFINPVGHFSFFENENIDLKSKFTVIDMLEAV